MNSARFTRYLMMASMIALVGCSVGKAQPVPASAAQPVATTAAPGAIAPAPATTAITNDDAAIYARLSRVESDVAGMKDQMSQMGPLLQKMPALQDKLSELVTELQRIDERVASAQEHAATLQQPAPVIVPQSKPVELKPAPTPEPTVKPAPAKGLVTPATSSSEELLTAHPTPTPATKPASKVKGIPMKSATVEKPADKTEKKEITKVLGTTEAKGAPAVQAVRIGDDAQKTRLVLDLTQKTPFTYDLDNNEKILIIDMDASAWTAAPGASFAKSPLVASYTAQAVDGGKYRLVIQLKEAVKVQTAQALLPNGEKGDRIVFDLVKAK